MVDFVTAKTSREYLSKLQPFTSLGPAIPLLGICPTDVLTHKQNDLYIILVIAAFVLVAKE